MKLSPHLLEGIFLERPNRFAAWVEVKGVPVMAHVPNSGRMRELLWPGSRVLLTPRGSDGRKTAYDLSLVDLGHALVSSDARLPSALVAEAYAKGQLDQFSQYAWLRREVPYLDSRLDILLGNGGLCYIEVKSVTLVEDGVGLFPDAPTSRGARHVEALARAIGEGHRAVVVFVVQREDATAFVPNDGADPHFGETLRRAHAAGVEAYAYRCRVSIEEIEITEPLPVFL
ncbi:MAG: DNA/RNA nuclease SfsA [Chloroflexi bacterium]|nr:DNA/RNA nuclease SfsA [Chloroflexota bacterium]